MTRAWPHAVSILVAILASGALVPDLSASAHARQQTLVASEPDDDGSGTQASPGAGEDEAALSGPCLSAPAPSETRGEVALVARPGPHISLLALAPKTSPPL